MREDVEKLVFDAIHEVARKEFDGFQLRQHVDAIMAAHDKTVEDEHDVAYDDGYDSGRDESYWDIDDARSEGYDDGYQDGYDTAKAEFENDPSGA